MNYVYDEAADGWRRKGKGKGKSKKKASRRAKERTKAVRARVSASMAPAWNGTTWTIGGLFNRPARTAALEKGRAAISDPTRQSVTSRLAPDAINASSGVPSSPESTRTQAGSRPISSELWAHRRVDQHVLPERTLLGGRILS